MAFFTGNPFANLPVMPQPTGGAPLPPGLQGGTLPLNLIPSPAMTSPGGAAAAAPASANTGGSFDPQIAARNAQLASGGGGSGTTTGTGGTFNIGTVTAPYVDGRVNYTDLTSEQQRAVDARIAIYGRAGAGMIRMPGE